MKRNYIGNKLRSLKKNKVVFNQFVISVAILLSVTFLSNFFLYFYFNNVLNDFYAGYVQIKNTEVVNRVSELRLRCSKVATQLMNEKSVANVLYNNQSDYLEISSAIKSINSIKAYNDIAVVTIYNEKEKLIWQDSEMLPKKYDDYIKTNKSVQYIIEAYENNDNFINTNDGNNVIAYTFKDYRGYYVIMYFNENYFAKTLFNSDKPIEYTSTLYFKDRAIANSSNADVEIDLKNIESSMKLKKNIYTYTDMKSSIVYVYTKIDNFICLSKIDYASVMKNAKRLNFVIWISTLLLLIFEIIIIYSLSDKFKGVIQEQIKSNKFVKDKYNIMKTDKAIYNLLNHEDIGISDRKLLGEYFKNDRKCRIMTFFLEDLSDSEYDDFELFVYGIINIMEESFSVLGTCKASSIASQNIGLMLTSDRTITDVEIEDKIDELRKVIDSYIGLTFSVFISTEKENIDDCIENISKYVSMSRYRFIVGQKSTIFEKDIPNCEVDSSYPEDIQRKIIASINENNTEEFEKNMNGFIESITINNYGMAQEWLLILFINIIKASQIAVNFDMINRLSTCNTLSGTVDIMKSTVYPHLYRSNKQNDPFVDVCEEMFKENYSNPDFSINDLSEKLDITSVYAGYKFKKIFNKSFNQYLAEYRIGIAREMLKKQDNKVVDIATACGFRSSTYFVTIFKKYMQMTPQDYRTYIKNQFKD